MLPTPRERMTDRVPAPPLETPGRRPVVVLTLTVLLVPVLALLVHAALLNVLGLTGEWHLDRDTSVTIRWDGRLHVPDSALGEYATGHGAYSHLVLLPQWPPRAMTVFRVWGKDGQRLYVGRSSDGDPEWGSAKRGSPGFWSAATREAQSD